MFLLQIVSVFVRVFKCIFFRVLSFLLCHKLTGRSSYLLFNNIVIHMVGNDKEIVMNSHKLPMENKTKVVSCLFAAAVADPLGAGAVGDGCELKKVFYLSFFINCFSLLSFFINCLCQPTISFSSKFIYGLLYFLNCFSFHLHVCFHL